MGKLAIKGHATRGKEVIEILEMLGGTNRENYWGVFDNKFYLINALGDIDDRSLNDKSNYQLYTLEEFLEKFPYKIGDKVYNIVHNENQTITRLTWQENEVIYQTNNNEYLYVNYLQPYKEETMEVSEEFYNKYCVNCGSQRCTAEGEWLEECKHYKEETMNRKYNVEEYLKVWEETENGLEVVVNDNFELKEDNGKFYIIKKQPQYPKTFEDCCRITNSKLDVHYFYTRKDKEDYPEDVKIMNIVDDLRRLIICRNAYWKIAGEQMGLGKPWQPDFTDFKEERYGLYTKHQTIVNVYGCGDENIILVFPTAEMRNAFYENFKDLINQCKELL